MKKKLSAIQVQNLNKTYPHADRPALENVSITINEGDRVGLIGGNGSGKTTLLRLIMNFLVPDSGSITIFGEGDLEKARRYLGFLPERQTGLENFTPRELLKLSARMYSLSMDKAQTRMVDLLRMTELTEVADKLMSGYSKGMAQRVQICNALLHDPPVLLLDEPMSGLDPGGQREVGSILKKLDSLTLIYATHQLEEIENFCTSAIILHRGKLIQQVDLRAVSEEVYTVDISSAGVQVLEQVDNLDVVKLSENSEFTRVQFQSNPDQAQAILARLSDAGESVQRLRSRGVLEELYHEYVRREK